jgi:hypothetical protein
MILNFILYYNILLYMPGRTKNKDDRSTKIMKVSPSVHADLIGLARYGDSLSDVVARLTDFYKKNHKEEQK